MLKKRYYETIKTDLPENIVNMQKDFNFHDAKILTVEVVNDYLNIELEHGPCYSLTFVGGKLFEKPDEIFGCYWIHDEVHLSDRGKFEFCVLLRGKEFLNLHELRFVADDVLIYRTY